MNDDSGPKTDPDLVYELEPGLFYDANPGAYQDENGCDLTLIDVSLAMTPAERVRGLRRWAEAATRAEQSAATATSTDD